MAKAIVVVGAVAVGALIVGVCKSKFRQRVTAPANDNSEKATQEDDEDFVPVLDEE